MSYGFIIEGDFGQILVDDTFPVYQVLERKRWGGVGNGSVIYTDVTPQHPDDFLMVFSIPPASGAAGMYVAASSFLVHEARLEPGALMLANLASDDRFYQGAPFLAHHFYPRVRTDSAGWEYALVSAFKPGDSGEDYGLRVWGADEQIVYDSAYPLAYFRLPPPFWTFDGIFQSANVNSGGADGKYARYSIPVNPDERIGYFYGRPLPPAIGVNVQQSIGFEGADRSRLCMYVSWSKLPTAKYSPPPRWSTDGLLLAHFP